MKLLTTKQVVLRIAAIVSSAELLIMLALGIIPHKVGIYSEAAIDVALLTGLTTPLIYIWIIQPFVTGRDEALAQINHLAHTDTLTQLANRRLLSRDLQKVLASSARHKFYGVLLLIDLDGFKLVNDAHGHYAGDLVLVEIAKRLLSITRAEDLVGRLGGDEFTILISHLDADKQMAREKALLIAEKIIHAVSEPIDFNGNMLHVSGSIGIRLLGFEDLDAERAIREADIAMYHAKLSGKGCAVCFEKEMGGICSTSAC